MYDGTDNLMMRFDYGDARMPVAMNRNGVAYYLTWHGILAPAERSSSHVWLHRNRVALRKTDQMQTRVCALKQLLIAVLEKRAGDWIYG
jgi:hypothetical protein